MEHYDARSGRGPKHRECWRHGESLDEGVKKLRFAGLGVTTK
jgi:hypothetical protein